MGENQYVWSSGAIDVATARLEQLECSLDPATYGRLDRIGVPRGGRCWEIGAGRGTTALFLLAKCGLGEVVATDIDVQWLDQIRHPCLQVRHHDVVTDDLDDLGMFDLIHARLVIHHLGVERGAIAVARAASRLNPGGVLFLEEPIDLNRTARHHPEAESFERLAGAISDFLTKFGLDLNCGLQLPHMLRALGLIDVDSELSGSVTHGGDPLRTALRLTVEVSRATVPFDSILGGHTDDLLRLHDDPDLDLVPFIVAGAWGRRPA